MAHDHRTLYEILGITRNAKPHEVERAYRRLRGRMQQEAVAPDARETALVQKAHEVLSDPVRRDAYDESLATPASVLKRARASRRTRAYVGGGTLAAVLAVGGAYCTWRSTVEVAPRRDPAEIAQAASLAVGRVQAVDVGGGVKPLGLAFAVEQGMLATSCQGLTPTTQLVVSFAQRKVPARVATIYGRDGVCRLAVDGMGSWPLSITSRIPRIGAVVYGTQVAASGQVTLVPVNVRHVIGEQGITTITVGGPVEALPPGGPLLDAQGQVLGVGEGAGRFRPVPREWIAEMNLPPPEVPSQVGEAAARPEGKAPIVLDAEKNAHDRAEKLKYLDNLK
jgi:hypothetical protein